MAASGDPGSDDPKSDDLKSDDPAEAMTRLEAALERIAQLAQPAVAASGGSPATAEAAYRLDTLIAQLRGAVGEA